MLTVQILVNNQVIYARAAKNVSSVNIKKNEPNAYKIDTGKIISHIPNNGACNLAKKLIDTIVE